MTTLNALCPYFTMFPLDFPMHILNRYGQAGQRVLDPFCGRGTTNFAARLLGLNTVGIDSSSVATAITAAKLATTNAQAVVRAAQGILDAVSSAAVPTGEFWALAYHAKVLRTLTRLRAGLLADCSSHARRMLRGIILGALHGPACRGLPSYFSNQCTRTYAPKPGYAVKYWRAHKHKPAHMEVLELIERRAKRYLEVPLPSCEADSLQGDSRDPATITFASKGEKFKWVITSPPYYGMRTYVPDQWLRKWFLGGSDTVDYSNGMQLDHVSLDCFAAELAQVWHNLSKVCCDGARMVIRFGGIRDRDIAPLDLIKASLAETGWRITTVHDAGSARSGKRQADSFLSQRSNPMSEYDVWACLHG